MRLLQRAPSAHAGADAKGNLVQVNYTAPKGMFSLDDASRVPDLVALGRAEAVKRATMDAVKQRFLNGRPARAFVPATDTATV